MQLLVSVADPCEVGVALAGGADLVDAKDPRRGALGAVAPDVLRAITAAVGGRRPTSAALGDATETAGICAAARTALAAGVSYVKVGFLGTTALSDVRRLAAAAVQETGAHPGAVLILVAYADWERVEGPAPAVVLDVAVAVGAGGVLLDTACKDVGLFGVRSYDAIGWWVEQVRGAGAGLLVALAGGLQETDVARVRELGADWVGVRGAACDGGRTGRLSAARVAALSALAHDPARPAAGARV